MRVEIFNLGAGRPIAAVRLLQELAVHGVRLQEVGSGIPPGEPVRTWADPERADSLLNLPQPLAVATGLSQQARAIIAGTDDAPGLDA